MTEYLSAAAASRRYGVSDKTIRKWITQGKLPAIERHIEGQRQHAISTDDIELLLAKRATEQLPEYTGTSIPERLEALEQRVAGLEQELQRPTLQKHATRPRTIEPSATPDDLPAGTLHIQQFLELHNLKEHRRRILSYLDSPGNGLQFHAYPKLHRPDETDRYLTPDQQEALLTWLRSRHPEFFA